MAEEWITNPSEDFQERISICRECPDFFQPTKTCKHCNCFMLIKARLKSSTCPLNKW